MAQENKLSQQAGHYHPSKSVFDLTLSQRKIYIGYGEVTENVNSRYFDAEALRNSLDIQENQFLIYHRHDRRYIIIEYDMLGKEGGFTSVVAGEQTFSTGRSLPSEQISARSNTVTKEDLYRPWRSDRERRQSVHRH